MKSINGKLKLTLVLGAIMLFISTSTVYSVIVLNGAGGVYGSGGKESTGNGETIETLTVISGGYFLNSYSDILIFLNRVEMSDIYGKNYDDMNRIVNRALVNIESAKKLYFDLVSIAENSPYNELAVAKLHEFDYNGFMVEKNFNEIIFREVESHLKEGDITGLLKIYYQKVSAIVAMVKEVKEELSINRLPEISDIWRLNQQFSKTLLLGQYAAAVFQEIK